LTGANFERLIFVSLGTLFRGYEIVPRNRQESLQHALIADSALAQLQLNHQLALAQERIGELLFHIPGRCRNLSRQQPPV
jgi:hypothetical protein